jgi:DNA repair photolyase
VPAILQAAADAGAQSAGYVLLRLPHQVKALFLDWLHRHVPERAGHVESLIRQTRDGALYDSTSGVRMRGQGQVAEQIGSMFKLFRRKTGLNTPWQGLSSEHFVRPMTGGQMSLFDPPATSLFP